MTENKEYWATLGERGNIKISEDVIMTIASLAVLETEGADSVITGLTSDIAGLLGKKTASKGVKVTFVYDDVEIDITCQVKFGSSVFETAEKIQENVKNAIESMTGLTCKVVNITITGVSFDKE
ncbi:MAG: Asp23/Gls24 family envelope stress response protein [Clostridia bacterium]